MALALPAAPGPALAYRLAVGGWNLSQGVQDLGQHVPLAAGREGLLRVFVVASGPNRAAPSVRVTLRREGRPAWTRVIPAPRPGTPVQLQEGNLDATWNVRVPGEELAPGTTLELELDPERAYPGAHPPRVLERALDVREAPPFRVLFVPVAVGDNPPGTLGSRAEVWLERVRLLFPLPTLAGGEDLRTAPVLAVQEAPAGGSAAWGRLLLDLALKERLEGEGRLVYGVLACPDAGGRPGAALLGGGVAAGRDGSGGHEGVPFAEAFAHGAGHALGLPHRPCGPEAVRPERGETGAYGFDLAAGTLMPPTLPDLMTACRPAWVGPATFKGILEARRPGPPLPPRARCLLVSGRIRGGAVELDPAFTLDATPGGAPGEALRLEALDAQGNILAARDFSPFPESDLDPQGASFALALPLAGVREDALAALRILKEGRERARRERTGSPAPAWPRALGGDGGRVNLRWEPGDGPAVLVRHGRTGQMLARGEGGSLDVHLEGWELAVDLSDGVASRTFRVNVMLP